MFCTNCGQEVPDNANVCGHCGHRLKSPGVGAPPVQPQFSQEGKGGRKGPGFLGGVLVALIFGGVVAAALFFFNSNRPALEIPEESSANVPAVVTVIAEGPENDPPPEPAAPPEKEPAPESAQGTADIPPHVFELLNKPELLFREDRINLADYASFNARESDGVLEIDSSPGPNAYFVTDITGPYLDENEAFLVRFKESPGGRVTIDIRTDEEWGSVKNFTVGFNNEAFATVDRGEWKDIEPFENRFKIKDDHWYLALIAVGPQANFLISIWDEASSDSIVRGYQFAEQYDNLKWAFNAWTDTGTIFIDYLEIYSFQSFR